MSGARFAWSHGHPAYWLACLAICGGCASASAPPPSAVAVAPPASLDQKVAWILRLEQQRVLQDPALQASAGEAAATATRTTGFDLARLLADPDAAVRARAALAVGRVGLVEGVAMLAAAMADPDPAVRANAALALGLLGHADARASLESALLDTSTVVRGRAIDALGLIGDPAAAPAIVQAAAGCGPRLAAIEPDDETWPRSPEEELCRLALFALVRLQTFDGLAQVALNSAGAPVSRWWPVAFALQRIDDPRAAAYLRPLLATSGVYTPSFALRGLAAAGDPTLLPTARAIATQADADPRLRVAAIRAIAAVGDESDVAPLIGALSDPALSTNLVIEIVAALGALQSPEAFDVLLELLTDRSAAVRAAALEAVARSNPDDFLLVLSGLGRDADWSVRAALAGVLGTLPADRVAAALEELAADEDARVHGPALEALVAVQGEEAVPRLLAALDAPDFVERATAARLIGELKPAGGVAALEAAYVRGDSDTAFVARGSALEALAEYGDAASVAVLRRALADREWAVRWRAAQLLHELGAADAEPDRPAPVRQGLDFFDSSGLLHPAYSPHAFIETRLGTIEIQLNVVEAAVTTASFVEQARAGLFNGLRVHRVVPGFVVQAGDPRGDGEGGPGYTLRDELSALPYLRGTVGIALAWPETGGSQWFITVSPQPHLDTKYTAFGRVVAGWDVLDRLSPWDVIDRVLIWDGEVLR